MSGLAFKLVEVPLTTDTLKVTLTINEIYNFVFLNK